MKHIIAHYQEIALKGKNRPMFVNKLLDNLRYATKGTGVDHAKDQGGRVILSLASDARVDLVKAKVFKSFRISTKRGYKEYPLTSMDVDRLIGAHIKEATGTKVDLTRPELTIFIEVLSKEAFFYTEKFQGQGGLPVGTGGKVACLLSGGIDSPIAAYRRIN